MALVMPRHILEVDDSSLEDVESALCVEGLKVLVECDVHALNSGSLHVDNSPANQSRPYPLVLALRADQEVQEESICDPVTEDGHVRNEQAVLVPHCVVGIVRGQDPPVVSFRTVPPHGLPKVLDLLRFHVAISGDFHTHLIVQMYKLCGAWPRGLGSSAPVYCWTLGY